MKAKWYKEDDDVIHFVVRMKDEDTKGFHIQFDTVNEARELHALLEQCIAGVEE